MCYNLFFCFPSSCNAWCTNDQASKGSLCLANCPASGRSSIKKRCCSIVVLLNNHNSHCTLDAILYCRVNGTVMCTFPPHCTHPLQPLDVAVRGPFKTKGAKKQSSWLLTNPGKDYVNTQPSWYYQKCIWPLIYSSKRNSQLQENRGVASDTTVFTN